MKTELIKNTLVIGIGRSFIQFSAFLLLPIYTLFLDPDEYGTGDLIITYATLALPLVTLSLEQGAFRLLVDARADEERKKQVISYLIRMASKLFVVLAVVALLIGVFTNFYLICLALVYVASSIGVTIFTWLSRGTGDARGYSAGSIFVGLSSLVLSVFSISWFSMGLLGMIGSLALANFLGIIYFAIRLRLDKYMMLGRIDKSVSKELLQFSLPLIPNNLSWWLVNAADRSIITLFLGVSSVGLFAVGLKFSTILISMFTIFWMSWHESASLHINNKDKDSFFSKVTTSNILLFGSLSLVILAVLSVIFPVIIGNEYDAAYAYVPILMVSALFHTVATLYGSIYAAKMSTKKILKTTFLGGVLSVITTVALIGLIGLYAAAVGMVVGYAAMTIYRHYDIRRYVRIRIQWTKVLILVGCALITTGLYYLSIFELNIINIAFSLAVVLLLNKGLIMSTKDIIWQRLSAS